MSAQATQLANRLYYRIMALEEENRMLKEALAVEHERRVATECDCGPCKKTHEDLLKDYAAAMEVMQKVGS